MQDIVAKTGGLGVESNPNFSKVKNMTEKLNSTMSQLNNSWTTVIPTHLRFIALGKLTDRISEVLSEEIFKLRDISELEFSHEGLDQIVHHHQERFCTAFDLQSYSAVQNEQKT